MKDDKIVKSYFGVTLESKVISQGSDVLVALLPGMGYTLDMPLMEYSKDLSLNIGFDVLRIEYGFQASRKEFKSDEEMRIVIEESFEILKKSLDSRYKRIIFIGKSIGTFIQRKLETKLEDEKFDGVITNIYLTPIDKTVELGLKDNSLAVVGSLDPLISKENREKIKMNNSIEYMEIENTGHSLDIKGDTIKSIEILKEIMIKEKEFLQ